jgi:fumarylacetoacetate (FAA) hydrolase family protein
VLIPGTLLGRAWIPSKTTPEGPSLITLDKDGNVYDISKRNSHAHFPTVTDLLQSTNPSTAIHSVPLSKDNYICHVHDLLENSLANNPTKPHLLAPVDIQSIKAAGVTFALSMLERVIEEQAKGKQTKNMYLTVITGDPSKALEIRSYISEAVGSKVTHVKPGLYLK